MFCLCIDITKNTRIVFVLSAIIIALFGNISCFNKSSKLVTYSDIDVAVLKVEYQKKYTQEKHHKTRISAIPRKMNDIIYVILKNNTHYEIPKQYFLNLVIFVCDKQF